MQNAAGSQPKITAIFCIFLLFQEVYSMAVFPFPQLAELREKYTYNITPFPTSVKSNGRFVPTEEFSLN